MPQATLTTTDASSPIRKVVLLDDDWAVVTVEGEGGATVDYTVRRQSPSRTGLPPVFGRVHPTKQQVDPL